MLYWLTLLQSLPTIDAPPAIAQTSPESEQAFLARSPGPLTQEISPPPVLAQVNSMVVFPGIIAGFIVLLLLSVWAYTRVYIITPTNEAFVRTGGIFLKQKTVILNGGCVVLPGFHEITRVPLRELSIDVERTGKLAVRTKDYLRAEMRVTFYVCIAPDQDDVRTAAARLSNQGRITPDDIKNALEKRADDAIRAAAKTKNLAEIDSDKLGFAQEVLNLIEPDIKKVGLTLNNIAISEIEESNTYDTDNFFDAQGVRLRTETVQRSIQQKREVELLTQVTIEQKELTAQKQSLQLQQEKESALLAQQLEVEAMRAKRAREIQESKDREAAATQRNKILQEKAVEEEDISRQLSVKQKQIDADIELEERNKKLKVAQALQKQEAEMAEIARQQAVDSSRLKAQIEVAEAEKLSRTAQQEAAIAIAQKEQERFLTEAERAKAEASVTTATEVEKAERAQRLALINAQQEADQRRIADQNIVEIDVFRRRRQAEIARQAADLEAESIRTLASAERDRLMAEAEGRRAVVEAENALSDANRTAQLISALWPQIADQLPELARALAPQPGVLGNTRIYAFPGQNGSSGIQDINKLMLSSSGLALINALLEDEKLSGILGQVGHMLRSKPTAGSPPIVADSAHSDRPTPTPPAAS
ncbi:flotillin family protein [Geitlerinema sp. PCC 7407]|uniref:flotillin family protein n=1 Tax=Geitlerinema sp. PCC 7407 TaxID=1173025 RepID=UPI00029FC686|nr:flotillin family protein [Geitlerinema sp. PCC 7407]AFY64723.1 band 7 protein [Geitlerinema sp. PCC 7407]